MSARRLRVLMIAFFLAAAILSAFAGNEPGPFLAASFGCFAIGVLVFIRWRRALRASVFDRGEKTSDRNA